MHITNEIARTTPMVAFFVSMSPQHWLMSKKTGNKNDEKRMRKILVTVLKAKLNVMIAIALDIMEEFDILYLLIRTRNSARKKMRIESNGKRAASCAPF